MAEMRPYVKNWYDNLAKGKLTGVRCKDCGEYEFPCIPICNHCSGTNVEEVEMSGKAKLIGFSSSVVGMPPYQKDPVLYAHVQMEEGPDFISWLPFVKPKEQEALLEKLPEDLEAEIVKIEEEHDIYWPIFHLAEQTEE